MPLHRYDILVYSLEMSIDVELFLFNKEDHLSIRLFSFFYLESTKMHGTKIDVLSGETCEQCSK